MTKDNQKIFCKSPEGRYWLFPNTEKYHAALRQAEYSEVKVVKVPSMKTLMRYSDDGICPTPVCGCRVEPDGHCQHGRPSWLILMGVI